MIRLFARATLAATLLFALAAPTFAHITLETQQAAVGSTYKAVLRVPHGCEGAATTAIHVQIPPGFISVKPMPKAGWTLDTVTGPYGKSYDYFGESLSEGVTEIVWSGGNLPDAWYDEFVFRGTFDAAVPPGKVYFPVVQSCGTAEDAWIDVSGDENAELPAPSLELVPGDAHAH